MSVPILCPFCGVSGSVPDHSRGHHCRCRKCGNRFKVPELLSAVDVKPVEIGNSPKEVNQAAYRAGVLATFIQAHPLVFGICVTVAILGAAFVFVAMVWIGFSESHSSIMSRERFKYLVMGENEQTVIKAVGRPDSTFELGGQNVWHYYGRTRDHISGRLDRMTTITFGQDGKVASVGYSGN